MESLAWRLSLVFCLAVSTSTAFYLDNPWELSGPSVIDPRSSRHLLDSVGYSSSVINAGFEAYPSDIHQQRRLQQRPSHAYNPYDEDLREYEALQAGYAQNARVSGHRKLQQLAPAAGASLGVTSANLGQAQAPSAHGVQGMPSNSTVYTIVNNNDAQYSVYVCIDACAHGNTCVWDNAWLWMCNGTNPTHHYWVWEPDTLIIRSATTDSFQQDPEICLDMCTDTRYGNGACAMTSGQGVLNVGYAQCTGASNQQWTLNGTQIINQNNSQCLSAGSQPCGKFSNCNKSQAQTRTDNNILNVFVETCDSTSPNQKWSLGSAPNSTLIDFIPLNVSAAEYPPTVPGLAALVQAASPQTYNFMDEATNLCMGIENQATCQTYQAPGSSNIVTPTPAQVCVWNNLLLQTCWAAGSTQAADQGWLYDNTTKLIALGSDTSENACIEMCVDDSFAHGACSLVGPNNLVLQPCSGSPAQQFDFMDGMLYNELTDTCIANQPICLIDYTVTLVNASAANAVVNNFTLGNCLTNVKNGPWAALPWNGTNGGPLGIQNLVGLPCDSNTSVIFEKNTAGTVTTTDPVVPGALKTSQNQNSSGGSNAGAIAGGVAGGAAFLLIVSIGGFAYWVMLKRRAERERLEAEYKLKMYNSGKLSSIDSDYYNPVKRSAWFENLDLGDEINPEDIEICTHPDGGEWKLGEGAFGTVYRANRFGVQPVAVKALREESSKQIENFQREIELLRGLRDNNIVLFLGVCKKDHKLMLVTEFMPGGDLWHALNHSNSEKYTWYHRGRKIALDVARGLVHLHSRDIVHMDLKSPNILLGKDLTAKIADVGLARSINNFQITQMTSIGTMAWAAPELKRNFKIGRKEGPRNVTAAADVFSFGVVLWEIVTAEDPTFSSRECRVPEECPEEIERLIEDCLDDDPEMRPTMKQCFERLKRSASIPAPGLDQPIATPAPTPPLSRDGTQRTPPRSKSPQSGGNVAGYVNRLGLAAALKKKLGSATFGPPKSNFGPPKSTMRADCILEEEGEGEEQHEETKLSTETVQEESHKEEYPDDDSAKELTENNSM